MGTKKFGWSAAKLDSGRFLAVVLSVFVAAIALPVPGASAADVKKARDKIVDFNKQALASYDAKDFEAAKDLLTKALKEAKQAGLDDDKMTARTYLHLGAVYWTGYKDQASAAQNFSLAKRIRPDIQLTPSIETPELKTVFDQASAEPDTAPPPAPVRTSGGSGRQPRAIAPASGGEGGDEPDLPRTMAAPLMCAVPQVAAPEKDLSIRCALKPSINARTVQLYYRTPGVESYQVAQMKKTPRGWWIGTVPGTVMAEGSLQVYVDARDANDKELASNGHVDSPTIIAVRKGSASGGGDDEDDPMKRIRMEQRDAAYEAGLHRRREGAVWIGMGIGSGFGFAPAGSLEARKDVKVSAVTAPVGMYHLLPEVGYLWSESFALSLQGIIEVIRQDQLQDARQPTNLGANPQTLGWATLARAIFLTDLAGGNLQFQFSGDAGWGFMRIPVAPLRGPEECDSDGNCGPKPSATIFKTDARLVGNALLGASAGFTYHLSRYFAVSLDGRVLMGVPNFGAMIQGWFSAQVAFGGKSGAAQPTEDNEDEGDVPRPGDDAPSDSSESEEEEE